jgi:hypothetical protein
VRVGELACGRSGDKGPVVDFTLVARDDEAYALLAAHLDAETAARALGCSEVRRYEVPGLRALKFVAPDALAGGAFASLRAGVHSQKAWIHALLDLELPGE